MDDRMVIQELNKICKKTNNQLLKQNIASIMIGLFIGIPENISDKVLELSLEIKKNEGDEPKDASAILKHSETIEKLSDLFKKIKNKNTGIIIGSLVIAIRYNKLDKLRNILVHINYLIENYDFETDISTENRILH